MCEKETGEAQGMKLEAGEKGIDNFKVPLRAATSFLEVCCNHILAHNWFFQPVGFGFVTALRRRC